MNTPLGGVVRNAATFRKIRNMNNSNKQIQHSIYENAFTTEYIHYDDYLLPPNDYIREKYFARECPVEGMCVLEIGIGISSFLCRAAHKYKINAFGLDYVNSSLLAQNRNSNANLRLCRGDAESLPYKKYSFDIVIAISVIEHLSDYNRMFAEIWRVLKPKGTVVIQCPCRDFRFSLFARLKSYESLRHAEWFLRIQNETGHDYGKIPDRNGWKQLAIRNGFAVKSCDASDICLDSWMMYYFFNFLKRIQSSIIRLKTARSHCDPQLPLEVQCGIVPGCSKLLLFGQENFRKYSSKRRFAGFLWYHIVLKAFPIQTYVLVK